MFQINDRVVYVGPANGLKGSKATVTRLVGRRTIVLRFDGDLNDRPVYDYEIEKENTVENFKTAIKTAVDKVVTNDKGLSAEDTAARTLGLGYELARMSEELKKKAKASLTKLGLLPATESGTLLETKLFLIDARMSEPGRRLNEAGLRAALEAEKLSAPARARIMAAAFKEAAPATTFKVEQR